MSPKLKKALKYYLVAGAAYAAYQAYKSPAARDPMTLAKNVALWPAHLMNVSI